MPCASAPSSSSGWGCRCGARCARRSVSSPSATRRRASPRSWSTGPGWAALTAALPNTLILDGFGSSRANPYSISAAPQGDYLRITASTVGDGSARLAGLKEGSRVLLEGPYGRLHEGVRTRRKVLLVGAGIGITPMRALLEGLDQAPGDVTLVHRAGDASQLWLREELTAISAQRGARYVTVEGHRAPGRSSWLPASAAHLSDAQALAQLVPDVAEHDVFICGAPAWMDAVRDAALACGVPSENIHLERFAY